MFWVIGTGATHDLPPFQLNEELKKNNFEGNAGYNNFPVGPMNRPSTVYLTFYPSRKADLHKL